MKNKLALLFLFIILVMSCGCVVFKKNVDPMKEEMIIPKEFKITNAPPPLNIQAVIESNKPIVAIW